MDPGTPVAGGWPSELDAAEVVIVSGSGGVGKTTVAAALGAAAALTGRRVLVLTIDPARRLADALGLQGSGDASAPVALPAGAGGHLAVRMLDRQAALDRLISRHAPTAARRDAILSNRFYRQVSSALVGAHEYVAMEELADLAGSAEHDLLVLDTPPAGRALDFLDAPGKIAAVLADPVFRLAVSSFATVGKVSLRGLGVAGLALKGFSRLLGADFLRETLEFLVAFHEMFDGFEARAGVASRLLAAPTTAFVVVTTPRDSALSDAAGLAGALDDRGLHLRLAVINRLHPDPGPAPDDPEALARQLTAEVPHLIRSARELERLLGHLLENHRRFANLARAETAAAGELARRLGQLPVYGLPNRSRPVHDVRGLLALAGELQRRT